MPKNVKQMILIAALMILMLALGTIWSGVGLGQENSGQITPENFRNWEVLKALPAGSGVYYVFFRNPDYFSEIKIVAAMVNVEFFVLGYRYFSGVNVYEFILDRETGKYVGGLLTGEKRRKCSECHKQLGKEAS